MAPAQKLDPPFGLPVRRSTIVPRTTVPLTPVQQDTWECGFIKHGPLFVGLGHSWRGIDSNKFKDGSSVGYISHCNTEEKEIPVYHFFPPWVSHPSLLIAREIFVARGNIYFYCRNWGTTLNEVEQLWPVYQLSRARKLADKMNKIHI